MVSGDSDNIPNLPTRKKVDVNGVKIGMIHGHQIVPVDDLESLRNIEREIDCNLLLTGHSHKQYLAKLSPTVHAINPGSATGAFSMFET